ncbi:hypothetical protein [Aureimonas sp. ME7]|uniref:hypothetical protein n=1 Tax=Aureimonas sp. ME7 TaxID=2744252 RepID=UPI0015F786F6|nr:hypothetical protein [Aureimonas sp. ME7]
MTRSPIETDTASLIREWAFPTAAGLGSSVRALGIEREIRAKLAFPDRKHMVVEAGVIRLAFEADGAERLANASAVVERVLSGIATLAVLPGEAEDILTISPRERQKWVKDGRLMSAGTRTVKLRGRSKAVTFHVFDPRHVEDVLDRDLPTLWREEDALAIAEARRRAAAKAALTRAAKSEAKEPRAAPKGGRRSNERPNLREWDEFDAEGFLR